MRPCALVHASSVLVAVGVEEMVEPDDGEVVVREGVFVGTVAYFWRGPCVINAPTCVHCFQHDLFIH